ncbi:MAG TPA: thiamine pyrophosphate-binding protein [Patescibacteria group bacterium]|nr:thiamine pyrophosphate-binding protein [Patescibacteria group bacterium]
MIKSNKQFITGAEVVVQACRDAGATMMYGYPITPSSEILENWQKTGGKCLQTEDEIAAGFAVAGGALAGEKVFTATSGPGHILMQDALVMAEAMRIPMVTIAAQRGGPSSGTVIYSQQEVTLACYGGNGEGFRLVYSPASLDELYTLTRRAFNEAWQYGFPTIVLTDGYALKAQGIFTKPKLLRKNIPAKTLFGRDGAVHLPNIFATEEELYAKLEMIQTDYAKIKTKVETSYELGTKEADILVIAHGTVGASAEAAVLNLRKEKKKVGLFRPVTLRPFPAKNLNKLLATKKWKKVIIIESSYGQLARLVHDEIKVKNLPDILYLQKPGLGIEPEEIEEYIKKIK